MKEAMALGMSCHLIDLSYGEILMATARDQGLLSKEEKVSYNDDYLLSRSRFVRSSICRPSISGGSRPK